MLWQPISSYPAHLAPVRWRCPGIEFPCGAKCINIGTPQITVQSELVSGGEFITFECERGHLVQPKAEHFK